MDRQERGWARLLPDHRTLYFSLDELDAHRQPGESDAQLMLRTVRFAEQVSVKDRGAEGLARDMMERAGLPRDDPVGLQLAMAMVVRSRFLDEHPHVLYVTVDEEAGSTADQGERQ